MKQIEFFNNISFFTEEDLQNFEKFLKSPFFNTLHAVIIVFVIIKNNIKLINDKNFKELKSLILTESKFSDIHLRKILSKLNEMYIEYIKIKALRSEKYFNEYLFSKYLFGIGNFDLLNKRVKTIEGSLSEIDNTDHDLFLKLFEIDTLKYGIISYSENGNNPLAKLETQKELVLNSGKNLFVYFIARETINFLNYVIQCNGIVDKKFSVALEKYFDVIRSPEFKSYNNIQKTTVKLFYKIFKLFNTPTNDSYYRSCKLYLNKVKHLYNLEFHKILNMILLSFCNFRQRLKDKDRFYYLEAFDLSYEQIKNQYYVTESVKYLDTSTYRNFVINCFNLKKKTLLGEFQEKHTNKLNPDDQKIMNRFCSAHLSYLNKNYEQSIIDSSILSDLKVYLKFDLFLLLIRTYYEISNFVKIKKTLHNYLYYIDHGDFFTKFEKKRYKYFHKYMNKFVATYCNYEKNEKIDDVELLFNEIESIKTFVMKNWLKEKLTKIISKHYSGNKKKRPTR